MRYKNRYTGDIREVVKEEDVRLDGGQTVHIFQLDDGSRWQASQFFAVWQEYESV